MRSVDFILLFSLSLSSVFFSWATYQKKMCILSRLYLPFLFLFLTFFFQSFCLKFKWTRIYIFYRFNIISKYRYFIQSNVCIQYFIAIYTLECFEGMKKKLFLLCIVKEYSFVLLMHSLYINTWDLCLCEFASYIQFYFCLLSGAAMMGSCLISIV